MSGSIAPNIVVPGYPSGNLVPGFYAGFDPSQANTAQPNQQALIIGQVTAGSTLTLNTPVVMGSLAAMQAATGSVGSMLSIMCARYRKSDQYGTVYVLPLADAGGATKAALPYTITGPATAAGTIFMQIAGQLVQVGVSSGDTATVMATNAVAAVTALGTAPVTAAAAAGVLTLTAINGGVAAGDITVIFNPLGTAGGQALPAGVAITAGTVVPGATDPTLTTALANIGPQNFDFIASAYSDATSITALSALLSQSGGRWSLFQALYGMVWCSIKGTLATRTTFGLGRNDTFVTCLGVPLTTPNPTYEIAADYAATAAVSLRTNPTLPLQTLAMTILPPSQPLIDTISEQQTLLSDGVSTYTVDAGGTVRISRAISFYKTNASGQPDNSWRDVPKTYTLMAGTRAMIGTLSSQFARKALVADGTVIAGGSSMVTSKTVLSSAIAEYNRQCGIGWMQSQAIFQKAATSQNQGNGVVALYLPMMLSDQLFVVALDIQFSAP